VAVPALNPVTTPKTSIEITPAPINDHTPPAGAQLSGTVLPTHTVKAAVVVIADGDVLTVAVAVLKQPSGNV
jgi:hypothetical protein